MTLIVIFNILLFGLTAFCFWLPYKCGHKITAFFTSIILVIILLLTLIANPVFIIIFLWLIIFIFQIIFITYWLLIPYNPKYIAKIVAGVLISILILFALYPWIKDWTFNKNDVRKILTQHNIYLKDDFKIIENERSEFWDYCQKFTLKISNSDFSLLEKEIRNSKNFVVIKPDSSGQLESLYNSDTINYETESSIQREFQTRDRLNDGTNHFYIELSKEKKEFNYLELNK